MATINDYNFIQKLIDANGYFEDDPRIHKIVKYINAWGGISYGVTWVTSYNRDEYEKETEYIINPEVIWTAENE